MRVDVRIATYEDALYVANNLRLEDAHELMACGHHFNYVDAVIDSWKNSVSFAGFIDGKLIGIFGYSRHPLFSGICTPWGHFTYDIEGKLAITFLRASRKYFKLLFSQCEMLENRVDARNELHLKWLKFLGFTVVGEEYINGYKFYRFYAYNGR